MARRFQAPSQSYGQRSAQREADYLTTWRRAANPATGGGTGDMLKATYDTNNDGFVDGVKLVTGALPTASVTYEGRTWYVAGSAGVPGAYYFCAKTGAGGYEWIFVGQTSQ